MTIREAEKTSTPTVDAAALFRKLGLSPADLSPIRRSWRQANIAWRRQRRQRIADHARRVREALALSSRPRVIPAGWRKRGKRPVWCVELRRHFASLSEAAAFVGRKASNISQAVQRGGRCGLYHWEWYEPREVR